MNAREGALRVLYEIEVDKGYSNIALGKEIKRNNYNSRDRGFLTELVYGVLENLIRLDYVISQFSRIKIKKIDTYTLILLRISTYQILFLDKIPPSAAVNESVNLSKKYCKDSSGFINGVLRSMLRGKEEIKLPNKKKDFIGYLSVTYSHPKWMVEEFLKSFSAEFTEALLKANNEKPDLNVRVNTLKTSVDDAVLSLRNSGFQVEKNQFIEESLSIKGDSNLFELEALKSGDIYIQDFGSMLVGRIVEPKENDLVIDICSAPGGKTTHMAQLMNNKGTIIARDVYDHKLELINKNAKRLGVKIINTEKFNGKDIDKGLLSKADKVLVDAPCSGLGIIRRKPEIKYRKQQDDFKHITLLQLNILKNAALYVKPGGALVYSTCSIDPRENIGVAEKFLKESPDYQLVNLGEDYKSLIPGDRLAATIQLYPNIHKTDGFFIAKFIKKT
ncbi:16S rRNA (cytosine(967)-C(5))-methyltransferase RsmB [Alkaliphilus pronyensis]|uniref:16S rRNA (cytosine(967)-C(5))-methyltransferase n=1 Tax=Alkaliphilus pronyensis TaxID=1482732 RepID=A0A6I0FG63_9FIRM|nr:16S rRNA (cytosine(967)-C(5))-methyltransferase RsmB [Alkaliphilus pronyensis]KAB3535231.1 16S rRNA (cytosine(967)-C(5))-methyltransferase RsmB [Alkaliphilus pronyensis]